MKREQICNVLIAAALDGDGAARLPKLYHDAGARVTLVSPAGFRITHSRYVHRHVASGESAGSVVQEMRELMRTQRFDAIVVASDPILYEIYRSHETAWIEPYLPVSARAAGDAIAGKNAFLELCRNENIRVPAFRICDSLTAALAAAADLGYPVVLKLDQGYAGGSVYRANDENEIRQVFAAGAIDKAFAVQCFIEGRVGTSAILYRCGKPCYVSSAYGRRCWPTPFSPHTFRQFVHHPQLRALAADLGRLLQYEGPAGIDWIEDADGTLYVLEVNARPTPMHVMPQSLRSFARGLRASLRGEPAPVIPQGDRNGELASVFPNDLYRVFEQRDVLGIVQWVLRFPFSRSVPWDDLPLLRIQVRQLLAYYGRQVAGIRQRAVSRLRSAIVK